MYKRLLALLVFVPMFLIAWYARNGRQSTGNPADPSVATRSSEPRESDQGERHHERHNRRSDASSNTPGDFDFYLLNLSWSPEFCSTHPGKPECAAHPGFVLHGLWPQNNDGSYPEHCSDAPGPPSARAFADIYPDSGLLQHEWSTHGTCSGLAPDDFFAKARTAVRELTIPPSLEALDHQTSLPPDAIRLSFAQANRMRQESLAVSCGNNYLTAVEVCLDKNLSPVVCSGVRTCRANSIRIVPPGAVDR